VRSLLALLFVALVGVPASAQNNAGTPCSDDRCAVEDPLAHAERMCADDPLCAPPRPAWYARTDFIMLRRDVEGVPIAKLDKVLNDGIYPQTLVLSTNEFEEPFRPGASLLIGHTLGDTPYQIEFSYFQTSDWQQGLTVRDATPNVFGSAGNLYSPFTNFGNPVGLPGFDYNNFVSIREESELYNVEVNVRHLLPMVTRAMAVSWLVGVRHIGIGEQFDYLSESAVPSPLGSALNLQTRTHNNLWGAQIGGRAEFYAQYDCWINFEIKGALCSNATRQTTIGALGAQAINEERSDNITSYVGDLSLELVYRPTRHLATRFGYQAMWIDRLTLAAQNFSPPAGILLLGPPQINVLGNAVYHGPHVGLELSW
jgi:hypothetical protein